ncbi:hypothetical protein QCE73_37400 [Caballeronia sp. LZ029]|uniref:hypothetical protein n=1 Tax=Caballeronia sp. LZ029 TaxID=3038564 RepID=UPI002863AC93|nr:hypothetical protein [Caballeronia sp. LZ029]MDR5748858.1 hypothetical protein [Caballeronia sp. LZ029]
MQRLTNLRRCGVRIDGDERNCEAQLAQALEQCLADGQLPDLDALRSRFEAKSASMPQANVQLASLRDYEALLDLETEVAA